MCHFRFFKAKKEWKEVTNSIAPSSVGQVNNSIDDPLTTVDETLEAVENDIVDPENKIFILTFLITATTNPN